MTLGCGKHCVNLTLIFNCVCSTNHCINSTHTQGLVWLVYLAKAFTSPRVSHPCRGVYSLVGCPRFSENSRHATASVEWPWMLDHTRVCSGCNDKISERLYVCTIGKHETVPVIFFSLHWAKGLSGGVEWGTSERSQQNKFSKHELCFA